VIKLLKKMVLITMLSIGILAVNIPIANAAATEDFSQYIGYYSNNLDEDRGTNPENAAGYDLNIFEISNGNITFSFGWTGNYWSPIYETSEITSLLIGNSTEFNWEDSWENEGQGTLTLIDGYVIINTVVNKYSDMNRASLGTYGDLILLPENQKSLYTNTNDNTDDKNEENNENIIDEIESDVVNISESNESSISIFIIIIIGAGVLIIIGVLLYVFLKRPKS